MKRKFQKLQARPRPGRAPVPTKVLRAKGRDRHHQKTGAPWYLTRKGI